MEESIPASLRLSETPDRRLPPKPEGSMALVPMKGLDSAASSRRSSFAHPSLKGPQPPEAMASPIQHAGHERGGVASPMTTQNQRADSDTNGILRPPHLYSGSASRTPSATVVQFQQPSNVNTIQSLEGSTGQLGQGVLNVPLTSSTVQPHGYVGREYTRAEDDTYYGVLNRKLKEMEGYQGLLPPSSSSITVAANQRTAATALTSDSVADLILSMADSANNIAEDALLEPSEDYKRWARARTKVQWEALLKDNADDVTDSNRAAKKLTNGVVDDGRNDEKDLLRQKRKRARDAFVLMATMSLNTLADQGQLLASFFDSVSNGTPSAVAPEQTVRQLHGLHQEGIECLWAAIVDGRIPPSPSDRAPRSRASSSNATGTSAIGGTVSRTESPLKGPASATALLPKALEFAKFVFSAAVSQGPHSTYYMLGQDINSSKELLALQEDALGALLRRLGVLAPLGTYTRTGPSGSSSAYHLHYFKQLSELCAELTATLTRIRDAAAALPLLTKEEERRFSEEKEEFLDKLPMVSVGGTDGFANRKELQKYLLQQLQLEREESAGNDPFSPHALRRNRANFSKMQPTQSFGTAIYQPHGVSFRNSPTNSPLRSSVAINSNSRNNSPSNRLPYIDGRGRYHPKSSGDAEGSARYSRGQNLFDVSGVDVDRDDGSNINHNSFQRYTAVPTAAAREVLHEIESPSQKAKSRNMSANRQVSNTNTDEEDGDEENITVNTNMRDLLQAMASGGSQRQRQGRGGTAGGNKGPLEAAARDVLSCAQEAVSEYEAENDRLRRDNDTLRRQLAEAHKMTADEFTSLRGAIDEERALFQSESRTLVEQVKVEWERDKANAIAKLEAEFKKALNDQEGAYSAKLKETEEKGNALANEVQRRCELKHQGELEMALATQQAKYDKASEKLRFRSKADMETIEKSQLTEKQRYLDATKKAQTLELLRADADIKLRATNRELLELKSLIERQQKQLEAESKEREAMERDLEYALSEVLELKSVVSNYRRQQRDLNNTILLSEGRVDAMYWSATSPQQQQQPTSGTASSPAPFLPLRQESSPISVAEQGVQRRPQHPPSTLPNSSSTNSRDVSSGRVTPSVTYNLTTNNNGGGANSKKPTSTKQGQSSLSYHYDKASIPTRQDSILLPSSRIGTTTTTNAARQLLPRGGPTNNTTGLADADEQLSVRSRSKDLMLSSPDTASRSLFLKERSPTNTIRIRQQHAHHKRTSSSGGMQLSMQNSCANTEDELDGIGAVIADLYLDLEGKGSRIASTAALEEDEEDETTGPMFISSLTERGGGSPVFESDELLMGASGSNQLSAPAAAQYTANVAQAARLQKLRQHHQQLVMSTKQRDQLTTDTNEPAAQIQLKPAPAVKRVLAAVTNLAVARGHEKWASNASLRNDSPQDAERHAPSTRVKHQPTLPSPTLSAATAEGKGARFDQPQPSPQRNDTSEEDDPMKALSSFTEVSENADDKNGSERMEKLLAVLADLEVKAQMVQDRRSAIGSNLLARRNQMLMKGAPDTEIETLNEQIHATMQKVGLAMAQIRHKKERVLVELRSIEQQRRAP